jgi:hypothetical protein
MQLNNLCFVCSCVDVDPDNTEEGKHLYLKADYSVDCTTDRYRNAKIVAYVFTVVYPIGIPCFMFYKLLVASPEIRRGWGKEAAYEDEKQQLIRMTLLAPIEYLYRNFKSNRWYWEVMFMHLYCLVLCKVVCIIP